MRLWNVGKYEGKSFEWLFFNKPQYVQWIHTEDTKEEWIWRNPDDEVYFNELYRRASHLTGVCPWCKQRMITRMCLIYEHGSGRLNSVSFDCDDCGYLGGDLEQYFVPSFFSLDRIPKSEQMLIVDAIKHQFIGNGRLTQKKMEEFFQTDHFFPDATPGFFAGEEPGGAQQPERLIVPNVARPTY